MSAADVEADILSVAHELAMGLHSVGAMSDEAMAEMDRRCLLPRPDYGSAAVRRIRKAAGLSQPMFARLMGVNKSAVAQWERGARRPSGPALRLLEVLDPEKPDSPVVQVRRGMGLGAGTVRGSE